MILNWNALGARYGQVMFAAVPKTLVVIFVRSMRLIARHLVGLINQRCLLLPLINILQRPDKWVCACVSSLLPPLGNRERYGTCTFLYSFPAYHRFQLVWLKPQRMWLRACIMSVIVYTVWGRKRHRCVGHIFDVQRHAQNSRQDVQYVRLHFFLMINVVPDKHRTNRDRCVCARLW